MAAKSFVKTRLARGLSGRIADRYQAGRHRILRCGGCRNGIEFFCNLLPESQCFLSMRKSTRLHGDCIHGLFHSGSRLIGA